jgi:hypothetical protein
MYTVSSYLEDPQSRKQAIAASRDSTEPILFMDETNHATNLSFRGSFALSGMGPKLHELASSWLTIGRVVMRKRVHVQIQKGKSRNQPMSIEKLRLEPLLLQGSDSRCLLSYVVCHYNTPATASTPRPCMNGTPQKFSSQSSLNYWYGFVACYRHRNSAIYCTRVTSTVGIIHFFLCPYWWHFHASSRVVPMTSLCARTTSQLIESFVLQTSGILIVTRQKTNHDVPFHNPTFANWIDLSRYRSYHAAPLHNLF